MSKVFETKLPQLIAEQKLIAEQMKQDKEKPVTSKHYSSTPFNVNSLMVNLKFFPADTEVKFGPGEYPDLQVYSWRGDYTESTLGRNSQEPVTVSDVVASLEWHIGKIQVGYKGGFYIISESSPLWAEYDSGYSSGVYLSGLKYDPETHVVWLLQTQDDY